MKKIILMAFAVALLAIGGKVFAADLIADGGDEKIDVGDVTVTLDTPWPDVTFTTADGWVMTATHVHIFFQDFFSGGELIGIRLKNGNPAPGKFDFKHEDLGGVTLDVYDDEIDLWDLFDILDPGGFYRILVAAHAEVEVAGDEIDAVATIGDGDAFAGFDSTAGFSTTDGTNNLGTTSLSLLSGFGQLVGSPRNLAHRGTRGLGVIGGEDGDELDSVGPETITLTFDVGLWISALELRSLFALYDDDYPPPEDAEVVFSLGGSPVYTDTLIGSDPLVGGNNGVASSTYATPIKADELLLRTPTGRATEFAFARLDFAREETAWGGTKVPGPYYELDIKFPGNNWAIYFDTGYVVMVDGATSGGILLEHIE